ncbi:MAG: hypothetical protein ABSB71_09410 [Candidatus Bathyarchaeia archaeon]
MQENIKKVFCLVIATAFLLSIVAIPKSYAQSSGCTMLFDCDSNPYYKAWDIALISSESTGEMYHTPSYSPMVDTSDFVQGTGSIEATLQAGNNIHEGYLENGHIANVDLSQKYILSFWAKYSYIPGGNFNFTSLYLGQTAVVPAILIMTTKSWEWIMLNVTSTNWQHYEIDLVADATNQWSGGTRQGPGAGFISYQDSLKQVMYFGIGFIPSAGVLPSDLTIHIDDIEYGYPNGSPGPTNTPTATATPTPLQTPTQTPSLSTSIFIIGLAVIILAPTVTVIYALQKKPKHRGHK